MALPAGWRKGASIYCISEWHHFHITLRKRNVSERGSRKDMPVKRSLNDAVWLFICPSKKLAKMQ